jgi:hypothetical protein
MALAAHDRVTAMTLDLAPLVMGAVGGIGSWFLTQFVAEPIRRFLGMRREIAQHSLDTDNVRARSNEKGKPTKNFSEQDAERLRDAQSKSRQLGTQMLSFVHTDVLATKVIRLFWRYDPVEAGRSLIGLSNELAVYGGERARHRRNILTALRIKPLP